MCKLKENNQREVRLSKDEIQILLHEAEQIDGRLFNIISLALLTGMRKSEILTLEWKEVNFDSSRIMLSSMKTKSRKARVIPITETISGILHSMYDKSNKLVAGDYTANVLRKQWLKLLKRIPFGVIADGTLLCFHDLRHIFAQALLDEGLSLEDIQFLLGHESITTTQERYAMFARPDLKSKISRMDNVVKLSRIAG
jgi:integrase